MTDLRKTSHYTVFKIGADTDVFNGRIEALKKLLLALEKREDYTACLAVRDALNEWDKLKAKEIPTRSDNKRIN